MLWWISVAVVGLLIALSESEGVWSTVIVVASVVCLRAFYVDPLIWIRHIGLPSLCLYALAYVGAGILWSVLKWTSYVYGERRAYEAERKRYGGRDHCAPKPPKADEHKGDIVRWMTYWPFSVVFTLLNDPIRRFFNFLYRQIGATLQRISDRAFEGAGK